MTVHVRGLPWVLPRVTVEIRGFPRQGPRLSTVHGAPTAGATVVAMARAAVLSVATSVVPTMATHGSTTAAATAYSMLTSASIAAAINGNQRRMPRHSTTFHGNPPTASVMAIRGNCHETPRLLPRNYHGRQTTGISTAFRGIPRLSVALRGNSTAILQ